MVEQASAFRFSGQSEWFDFWNARVVLPDEGRYFYLMPFVLSSDAGGELRVYDGGNGSSAEASREWNGGEPNAPLTVPPERWQASRQRCDVKWVDEANRKNAFSASRIEAHGPQTRWDILIEPLIGDAPPQPADLGERELDLQERFVLRRAPFIHRVPHMKALASGRIWQNGQEFNVKRAPLYLAKNHGFGFPDEWLWVYGNAFSRAQDWAFEVASLRNALPVPTTIARIAHGGTVRVLSSLTGDKIELTYSDGEYRFRVESAAGQLEAIGEARHRDNVRFDFPTPDGRVFNNNECLVGLLNVEISGQRLSTKMAALAHSTTKTRSAVYSLNAGNSQ